MNRLNHYEEEGLLDFYTFTSEEDAEQFKEENEDYNNIYYSYGWKTWIVSKTKQI